MHRRFGLPLLVLFLGLTSCADDMTATTTTAVPVPASAATTPVTTTMAPLVAAADVEEMAAFLRAVVEAHAAAWMSGDPSSVLALYDGDTVHDDSLFGVLLQGEELFAMPRSFFADFPGYGVRVVDVFVRPGVALEFSEGYGVTLRGIAFTEDEPMREVDRIEVGDDGLLGRWSLLYGLDMWEIWGAPGFRMDAATEVLAAHAAAWAAPDPAAFAALYSSNAERVDDLVGLSGTGSGVIHDLAVRLAGLTGDVAQTWSFADSRTAAAEVEIVGAVYRVTTSAGCGVRFATLLTVSGGVIEHEEIFWDPDALLACGWAG